MTSKEGLYTEGVTLADEGIADEAIEKFNEALAIDHDYKDALNAKGTVYLDLKRYTEARKYFNDALKIRTKEDFRFNYASTQTDLSESYIKLSKIKPERTRLYPIIDGGHKNLHNYPGYHRVLKEIMNSKQLQEIDKESTSIGFIRKKRSKNQHHD